jgi:hypothetical protein
VETLPRVAGIVDWHSLQVQAQACSARVMLGQTPCSSNAAMVARM